MFATSVRTDDNRKDNKHIPYIKRSSKKVNKKKKKKNKNDLFLDELHRLGLSIRAVTNDGNSLFRAISDQLHGNENNHHYFRQGIIEYMTVYSHEFSPFYVGNFNEYLIKMSQDGIHGGNMELTAATKRYKIDIIVHNLNAARYQILYLGKPQRSIHLSYHNDSHYASVRTLNDMKSSLPAKIINLHKTDINDGIVCQCGHRNKSNWMFCSNCGCDLSYNKQLNKPSVIGGNDGMDIVWKKKKCHCGSGRKYRKCCRRHRHETGNGRKVSLKVKCYCGSGKKYRKCCKVNKKKLKRVKTEGNVYDNRRLDQMNLMDESNMVIDRLEQDIANFSGNKQHKVMMKKELDQMRSQQNIFFNKLERNKNNEEKEECDDLFIGLLEEDNDEYIEKLKRLHKEELEKMKQQIDDLQMENEKLRQEKEEDCKVRKDKECVVCMDESVDYACVPCGHLCLCDKCMELMNDTCPVCQHEYESLIKIYS